MLIYCGPCMFSREPILSLGLQPIYLSTSDWGGSSCFFLSILIFSLLFNNHTKTQRRVINLFLSTTWKKMTPLCLMNKGHAVRLLRIYPVATQLRRDRVLPPPPPSPCFLSLLIWTHFMHMSSSPLKF